MRVPSPGALDRARSPEAAVSPVEQRHYLNGAVSVHYQVAGAGDPVVLVHGLSASSGWWNRNIGALARRYRVYTVDLIGFGRNRTGRFVLHEAANHLAEWLDALGIQRTHLVGHSMGGAIAADLAADHAALVDRLVLVDAAALPFNRGYVGHALGLARGLCHLPADFLPILVRDACRAGPRTLLQAARDLLARDLTDKLAQVEAPTRLIWGEHDAVVPLEIAQRLQAVLHQADLRVIAGAGHNPMWDRPAEFNQAVLEFLGAATAAPRPLLNAQSA